MRASEKCHCHLPLGGIHKSLIMRPMVKDSVRPSSPVQVCRAPVEGIEKCLRELLELQAAGFLPTCEVSRELQVRVCCGGKMCIKQFPEDLSHGEEMRLKLKATHLPVSHVGSWKSRQHLGAREKH